MPSTPKSFKLRCCKANPSAAVERGRRGTRAENLAWRAPLSSLSHLGACRACLFRRGVPGRATTAAWRPRAQPVWRRPERGRPARGKNTREGAPHGAPPQPRLPGTWPAMTPGAHEAEVHSGRPTPATQGLSLNSEWGSAAVRQGAVGAGPAEAKSREGRRLRGSDSC